LTTAGVTYDPAVGGNGPIGPGEFRSRQFTYTLPNGPRGVGQIQITMATDSGNVIAEANLAGSAEANNSASITVESTRAPAPDLQVVNLRTEPAAGLLSGSTVVLRWDDFNGGDGVVGRSFVDLITGKNLTTGEVFLSTTVSYDPGVAGNGSIEIGGSRSR